MLILIKDTKFVKVAVKRIQKRPNKEDNVPKIKNISIFFEKTLAISEYYVII